MLKVDKPLDNFWGMPVRDLLDFVKATPAGLSSDEAKRRLRLHGPNSLVGESRFATVAGFLRFFANPLVLILLAASAISIVLGDPVGGSIIIAIVLLSVIVNFHVEFQARHAVEDIRKRVATTAAVCATGTKWSYRSQNWCLGISSSSMPETWCQPTPVCWMPRTCTHANPA